MRTTTTVIVTGGSVVAGGLLSSDEGEFQTVMVASPDRSNRVVLAGAPRDLSRVLWAALVALDR